LSNNGGVRAEFTIYKKTEGDYYLVSAGAMERHDWDYLYEPDAATVLEHVMTRMARIRAEQEARFESLANGPRESYEQAAVRMLETEQAAKDVFEKSKTMNQNASTSTETIDITTDGVQVNDVNHREALRLVIGH